MLRCLHADLWPPCLQRIMGVKYSWPSNLHLTRECVDMMNKVFVSNPAQRINIAGIQAHPWFTKNLPDELKVGRTGDLHEGRGLSDDLTGKATVPDERPLAMLNASCWHQSYFTEMDVLTLHRNICLHDVIRTCLPVQIWACDVCPAGCQPLRVDKIILQVADLCPCLLQDGGKAAQKLMQPSPQSVDELKKILADARKKGTAPAKGEPQFCSGQCDAAFAGCSK